MSQQVQNFSFIDNASDNYLMIMTTFFNRSLDGKSKVLKGN